MNAPKGQPPSFEAGDKAAAEALRCTVETNAPTQPPLLEGSTRSLPAGCWHEGYYYCKHCGLDLTPDIAPFTGTYGDGPNCARTLR